MLLKYRPISRLNSPLWGFGNINHIASEFDRFNRSFDHAIASSSLSSLGIDWRVGEDEIEISAELPGYSADNVTVEITQARQLTIAGNRGGTGETDEEPTYLRRERRTGSFSRSLRLPYPVNADAIEAEFANGILTIKLPRAETDKPRQITVKAS